MSHNSPALWKTWPCLMPRTDFFLDTLNIVLIVPCFLKNALFPTVPWCSMPEPQVRGRKDWWNSCLSGLWDFLSLVAEVILCRASFHRVLIPHEGMMPLNWLIGVQNQSPEIRPMLWTSWLVITCDVKIHQNASTSSPSSASCRLKGDAVWKAVDQWFCAPRFRHGLVRETLGCWHSHISFWAPILVDVAGNIDPWRPFRAGIDMREQFLTRHIKD